MEMTLPESTQSGFFAVRFNDSTDGQPRYLGFDRDEYVIVGAPEYAMRFENSEDARTNAVFDDYYNLGFPIKSARVVYVSLKATMVDITKID